MSKELVEKEETLPALTEEELAMGTGQEPLGAEDMTLPKLQISSHKSKYMKEDFAEYIEGLKEGYIFNTLTEEIYGKEVMVAPIRYAGKNRIYFTPSFGVECKSDNAKTGGHLSPESCDDCQYSQWGTAQKGPGSACTLFENHVVAVLKGDKNPQLVLWSFKKKALETFKKFRTFIAMRKFKGTQTPLPMYRGGYKFFVGQAPGESGPYDVWAVRPADDVAAEDLPKTSAYYAQMTKKSVKLGDNE